MTRRPSLKLLILGLNYSPEMVGIGVYTSGMAEALAERHDVRVIAGQPYYPQWRRFCGFPAWRWTTSTENRVRVTRCPHYVPAKPTGLRRLLHHLSFAAAAFVPTLLAAFRQRPDVVLVIAPSIIAAPVGRMAAFIAGARSWLHIQDFEVEAAEATGLVREGLLLRLARWFERSLMRTFDRVSSISPKMCERLIDKGVRGERIVEVRNWADTDAIVPLDRPSKYRAAWKIETPHVALYSGNIGNKQGIEIIVDVARLLAHRTDLTFVVCGEGPNRARLEAAASGLRNIQFHDLQPRQELNELLGLASVHLLPQVAEAADLVLPSKLGNMLASGRPIVAMAALGTGLAAEIEGCGQAVPPKDARAFSAAMELLLDDSVLCEAASSQAYARSRGRWSPNAILSSFERELRQLDAPAALTRGYP